MRIKTSTHIAVLSLCGFLFLPGDADADASPLRDIAVGQWLEVRGQLRDDGNFHAEKLTLIDPQKHEELIGTATKLSSDTAYFELLGRRIKVSERTELDAIDLSSIEGQRVKVTGYYRGAGRFSAREVGSRGAGRDRLSGRVDGIGTNGSGPILLLMDVPVTAATDAVIEHERPPHTYAAGPARFPDLESLGDEDDLFGEGIALTSWAQLTAQVEARSAAEQDFDLDSDDAEDRVDHQIAIRARLNLNFGAELFGIAELRHRQLFRDDDQDGRFSDGETRLGETWLQFEPPGSAAVKLVIGRQDFDDSREWYYDENLDAVRAIWEGRSLRAEMAVGTVLFGEEKIDRQTSNLIAQVEHASRFGDLGIFVIRRDRDATQRTTHFGVRGSASLYDNLDLWIDAAHMNGRVDDIRASGFGLDAGATFQFARRWRTTLGFALGQGGERGAAYEGTFRQTGLQDNNGKLGGVTSFRYYGEVLDPELANLQILTAGIGVQPMPNASLDLVGHYYRQHVAIDELVDAEIDADPSGVNRNLGWGADLIFGWRPTQRWDTEALIGYFRPGAAFEDGDAAWLAKWHLRYRY